MACSVAPICAQAAVPSPSVYVLSIARQPLDDALQEFARQSGIQIVLLARVTEGLHAEQVKGPYTVANAMSLLLGGTSLTYRMLNSRTLQIEPVDRLKSTSGDEVAVAQAAHVPSPLAVVVVRATAEGVVATRTATPLREIPQTVSLISVEQMREQDLVNLSEALDRVPGITSTRNTSLDEVFYSRGFPVTSFHVDGSANLFFLKSNDFRRPDLAEFERIEVLRGADGLFSGNGDPGGSVNLVRKRPLDATAMTLDVSVGSWNSYRAVLDATGPLAFDGALRGRAVGVYHDQDSFYDAVTRKRKKLFGVLESDIAPDTLLTFGGSYEVSDDVPIWHGLPLNADGSDPHLPRSTALTTDWAFQRMQTRETYVQLQQAFGQRWKAKFGATLWDGSLEFARPALNLSRIDPATTTRYPTEITASFTSRPSARVQFATDLTLTGTFELPGMRGELALGGDYAFFRNIDATDEYSLGGLVGTLYDYTPSAYPNLSQTGAPIFSRYARGRSETAGAFTAVKLHFGAAWSVSAGARVGQDRLSIVSVTRKEIPWTTRSITPYAAVMYDFSEHYSLYASYADIYRDPTADLFVTWGGGGSRVKPDGSLIGVRHGVNLEAGIKAAWRGGTVNGALVGYRITQYRIPLTLPPGYPTGAVPGAHHSQGGDLELSGAVTPGWLLGAGYTFNDNRLGTGVWEGVRGPLYFTSELHGATPKHFFKLWTSTRLPGRMSNWTLGGNLRAQTTVMREKSVCQEILTSGSCKSGSSKRVAEERPSYALLDLRVSYQLAPNWRIGLTANNVFDKVYYDSIGNQVVENWYGEPRNYLMKVEASF